MEEMELFALIAAWNWEGLLFILAGWLLLVIVGGLWWVLSGSGKPHCGECLQQMPRNAKFCPHCGHERYKDEDNKDEDNGDEDNGDEDNGDEHWPRESWPNEDEDNKKPPN